MLGLTKTFLLLTLAVSFVMLMVPVALRDAPFAAVADTQVAGLQAASVNLLLGANEPGDLSSTESGPTPRELELFGLTNQDRARNGLTPLQFDAVLIGLARSRASAQSPNTALNHYDSSGGLIFIHLLADGGFTSRLAGENLARVPGAEATAAERAEMALMESPPHRANILGPNYTRLAVGSVRDAAGQIVYAQIFSAR